MNNRVTKLNVAAAAVAAVALNTAIDLKPLREIGTEIKENCAADMDRVVVEVIERE